MLFNSKFNIGNQVFKGYVNNGQKNEPCDTCNSNGRLKLEGKEFTIPCYTCNGAGCIRVYDAKPATRLLTIGLIEIRHTDTSNEERYMCRETGIGSGSVYNGVELFVNQADALAQAKILCAAYMIRIAEDNARYEAERAARTARLEEV